MGIREIFTRPKLRRNLSDCLVYSPKEGKSVISEILQGLVKREQIKFPSELGEEHVFDYERIEALAKKFGIISAIVDKHVDFIFSGGIRVTSEDERAQQVIEEFMRDFEFDNRARAWVRQGLLKGFSPMELSFAKNGSIDGMKVLNSNWMFAERDSKGNLKGFNQFTRPITGFLQSEKEIIHFEPKEIADLTINQMGDAYYGMGIIWQLLLIIDQLIESRTNMHTIMRRKSNNPLIFIMGDRTKGPDGDYPSPSEVDALGQKLEWLHNRHEWVISDYIKPMTLDFGKLGDKFDFIIENDLNMLFAAAQIPAVLMGQAAIPEGLAKIQMRAFELRIQSFREEIEKVIEEKIFTRVLRANGLDTHVEVEWGLPSQEEKNERIDRLTNLIKVPFISENLRAQLEGQIANVLDIPPEVLETPQEEKEREEKEEQLPKIPEGRARGPTSAPPDNGAAAGLPTEHIHIHETKKNENLDRLKIKEWIGFDYNEFQQEVLNAVRDDTFDFLSATTQTQIDAGLLTPTQIEQVRVTMSEAFDQNLTIREVEQNLNRRITFKDRLRMKEGNIILTKSGARAIALPAAFRGLAIARSEITRLSNLGAIANYKKHGVTQIRWVAAMSSRTCPQCEGLNGIIFNINTAPKPPLHTMCRCTTTPVFE